MTEKLSRKFYERLGDDIASELVDWFNAVDLTYQTQLRELNDLNWERFKATLHAEIASLRGELRAEIASLRGELRGEIAETRGVLHTEIEALRTEMHAMRSEVLKWTLVYWTTTMISIAGLFFAVLRTR
ncbi:MAG: hypothetical protein ABR582_07350 [Gemmatimonadaceae bacterium]